MQPIPPFWFKQRQRKIEPAGPENTFKAVGPNLGEAFLHIEKAGEHWKAVLRLTADGPEAAASDPEIPTPWEAWEAAFELYRQHVIG